MAAPQRNVVWPAAPKPRPVNPEVNRRETREPRRRAQVYRKRFSMLVVVPVLLMMGSVYLHTVAADLGDRAAALEQQRVRAAAMQEELDVRVSRLSAPGRIRTQAEALGMREPGSANLKVYESNRGDKIPNGGEEAQKNRR